MKKLSLDLDLLSVTSFETEAVTEKLGTVQGNEMFIPTNPECAAKTVNTYCPNTLCTCPPPR
ncbi:MAG TPA: hypothetical protein VJT67_15420 [Longimicrobiaceae bacterium]|nr:hypothetical protein [Longimicrobiaceae bacterium]